jgi:gliding motility-associated-like protein
MLPNLPGKFFTSTLVLCLFFHFPSTAQLNVDFTMDRAEGCSPLKVSFSAYGASSSASYSWDFGNGNKSSLQNPGAVFVDEKTYTVTLTVTDDGKTSSTSKTITVSKKPAVDFSASMIKGCSPQPITFTSNSTADNGNIAAYLWDFGDGSTSTSYSSQTDHTFLIPQKATITLSVTDNHGCTNSRIINDLITILPGVTAAFDPDKTFVCFASGQITMTNNSSCTRPLTYEWDFGDGTTSTEVNPAHAFNKKGIYSVKLTAKSDQGCTGSVEKPALVNVGEFESSISAPDTVCQGMIFNISNTSSPTPTTTNWIIDGYSFPYYLNDNQQILSSPGEHTVQINNTFGSCNQSVSKKIIVRPLPQPKGFLVDIPPYCKLPATVNLTDTNAVSVRSDWNFDYNQFATGKTTSYAYSYNNNWPVTLIVTDVHGCQNSVQQVIPINVPVVIIQATDNSGMVGCLNLAKNFSVYSSVDLASYNWDFGDGTTSADATPEHTFTAGNFNVMLHYTTKNGCKGDAGPIYITVAQKPVTDFTTASGTTTLCGPTPISLVANTRGITSEWYVNGSMWEGDQGLFNPTFPDTGKYSIMLIQRIGTCSDTMIKNDYVTVLPSYPQISYIQTSCEGDHGTVTLTQASRYAESGTWDFGDGYTAPFNPNQTQISHHFSKTGAYIVRLTTKSGSCENTTASTALVLFKQHAAFSAAKTDICAEEALNFSISNLDVQTFSSYHYAYHVQGFLFNDSTFAPPDYDYYYYNEITSMPYSASKKDLPRGKNSISVITSDPFGCLDTSNYIPVKLEGAQAAFQILNDDVCFKSKVVFNDTSTAENTTITSRTWTFGDGQSLVTTSGGQITHTFSDPSSYNVSLQITDAGGCTSTTSIYSNLVTVRGPKAAFSIYGPLHVDVPYSLYNNTNYYGSYPTSYSWDFGDGSSSTDDYPQHLYSKPGNYKIRLIAKNNETGCADTASQVVTVLNFNAHFSTTTSLINSQDCAPVLAQLTNTSSDYSSIKWDFGDGTFSTDNNYPSHLYVQPGKYTVKLIVTGNNGLVKTYTDSLFVIQKTANISANILRTCTSSAVTLTGIADASSYLWDFGDGTLAEASDTFSVHYYKDGGNYIPSLVIKDDNGCGASVTLKKSIAVDSINVSLNQVPSNICTPKEISFNPDVYNQSFTGEPLVFHWDFGTGNKNDTANVETPSFNYADPGNYLVKLKIVSGAGCVKEAQANILALKGLGAKIDGPSDICEQATAQFTGSTLVSGNPQWNWIFADGSTSTAQTPPLKKYNNAGSFTIKLIVDNSGCTDTITQILQVHPTPQLTTSVSDATICEGSSINLTVDGADTYSWGPTSGLENPVTGTVKASPVANTSYVVTGTTSFGCSNTTSINITVIHPFTIQSPGDLSVCKGKSVQLIINGGTSFQWINNTWGLSNTHIANPVAIPENTTTYTVVASGEQQCFSDTANIKVTVLSTPLADAGQGIQLFAGSSGQLHANGSADIVKWEWSPSKYLDCSNCQSPNVTPFETVNYTLTVSTADGCVATDTVSVKLLCGNSRIFIPNAFTPNHDGLNDVFRIKGQGVSRIDYIRIYDRWGELVFECSNMPLDDKNAAWDGRYKGKPAPAGTYVYIVEMSCGDQTFTQRGPVTVIY